MPRLPDDHVHDEELGTFEDYRHRAWDGAYGFWQSFLDFALRDNVLEVAVGLMYVSLSYFYSPPRIASTSSFRFSFLATSFSDIMLELHVLIMN
jgi:hypothetical protein